eukprot:9462714-Pyramimonas_sp.AAC.1
MGCFGATNRKVRGPKNRAQRPGDVVGGGGGQVWPGGGYGLFWAREIVESGVPRTEPRGLGMSRGRWWPGGGQVRGMGRFWARNR